MLRWLNVAEKPSAAKEISRVLSNGTCTSRPGLSQYNHVFEFDYTVRGQAVQMVFTSVTGMYCCFDR
jgi:DNA topoisomerase-3